MTATILTFRPRQAQPIRDAEWDLPQHTVGRDWHRDEPLDEFSEHGRWSRRKAWRFIAGSCGMFWLVVLVSAVW